MADGKGEATAPKKTVEPKTPKGGIENKEKLEGKTPEQNAPEPKNKQNNEGQQMLPEIGEQVRAEIAKELELTYAYQEARMEAGKEEKIHRQSAYALMEKYGFDKSEFVHGKGADQIRGFWEVVKKLKVRKGEAADSEGE